MNDSQPKPPNHQRLLEKAMAQSAHGRGSTGTQQAAPPSIDELAARFPDYQLVELLGQGGMGSVFKAVQKNLQRPVAIKVLSQEFAGDPELGERFLREARTLATLNHPGILTVHDYGERDGTFFLVTELVDGVNLRQLMELGELSPAEALRIAPQLCTALQFAHERGVVHRDIKPENILIDTDGQVKIADFGLAKVTRPGDAVALTRNTAVLGTPHYIAPEQWQGAGAVDHRADIYSLGVVIYEMLTGNLPLGNFDPPSQRGGVPHGLDAVVRRALAQKPENRYQHASEVQSDVEQQAGNLNDIEAPAQPALEHAPDAKLVTGPFIALAAALCALATLGYMIFLQEQDQRSHFRFRRDMAEYRSLANKAATQATAGQPFDTTTIALPDAPPPATFAGDAIPLAAISIVAGSVLLLLALGFHSVRRIRNSGGKKRGIYPAVITAWAVPLGAAGAAACAPINIIRNNDLQVIVGTIMISAAVYGAARFVMWEVARQRRLMADGVPMRTGGGWIATAFTLAFAAFGNVLATPRYLPANDIFTEVRAGETMPGDLVGKTREFVTQCVGPPLAIAVSRNSEVWSYKNQADKVVSDALVFANDRVISFADDVVVLMGNPARPGEPHLGQPIGAFIERYGQPVDRIESTLTTEFTFGNGMRITVSNGIVVGK